MLNQVTVQKLIVAGINVFLLSGLGSALTYIQYSLLEKKEFNNFDIKDTFGTILFFSVFIYITYALIFVVILYNRYIPVYLKSLILGLTAPIEIYFFILAFGGSGDLSDVKLLSGLIIFFIIGLLLPYFQSRLLRLIK